MGSELAGGGAGGGEQLAEARPGGTGCAFGAPAWRTRRERGAESRWQAPDLRYWKVDTTRAGKVVDFFDMSVCPSVCVHLFSYHVSIGFTRR